jgi:hypothetical protein
MPADSHGFLGIAVRPSITEKQWPCGCVERRTVWHNPGGPPDINTLLFACDKRDQCQHHRESPRLLPLEETHARLLAIRY